MRRLRARWLLALLLLPATARGDYRQSYLDAAAALERGDAATAARLLSAAIGERPMEQARARLVGNIPEPYLPHHLLALAHSRLGRCEEALEEWELSAQQGVAATIPVRRKEAEDGIAACRKTLGIAAADPRAASDAFRSALASAIDTYLDGHYARAIDQLEALPAPPEPGARAWQLALRAAARHALYRLGGEREVDLLAAAMADVREARRTDPAFRPRADLFSLRFRELWAAQR